MAHWPKKLLVDDFEQQLIRHLSTPISGTYTSSTSSSPGVIYIPEGMRNTTITKGRSTA